MDESSLIGLRDRALLLIGFAAALRRSELVALDISDITETADGLKLSIRRSKTDQDAAGRTIGIPYGSHRQTCPVRAWLAASASPTAMHGDRSTGMATYRARA